MTPFNPQFQFGQEDLPQVVRPKLESLNYSPYMGSLLRCTAAPVYRPPRPRGPNDYRSTERQRGLMRGLIEQWLTADGMVQGTAEKSRPSPKQPRPAPGLRVLPRT